MGGFQSFTLRNAFRHGQNSHRRIIDPQNKSIPEIFICPYQCASFALLHIKDTGQTVDRKFRLFFDFKNLNIRSRITKIQIKPDHPTAAVFITDLPVLQRCAAGNEGQFVPSRDLLGIIMAQLHKCIVHFLEGDLFALVNFLFDDDLAFHHFLFFHNHFRVFHVHLHQCGNSAAH